MNEIEERNNTGSEEVTQSVADSNISYIDGIQLDAILTSIRIGLIPIIEYHDEVPHTYKLYFNDGFLYYINEQQYDMIIEEIRNHESTEGESIESLPDSENSSPLSKEEEELLAQVVEEAHNEIPTNSGSLLINESTSRFSSAIWYEAIQKKAIILAGVGGIGRFGNLINF